MRFIDYPWNGWSCKYQDHFPKPPNPKRAVYGQTIQNKFQVWWALSTGMYLFQEIAVYQNFPTFSVLKKHPISPQNNLPRNIVFFSLISLYNQIQ